MYDSVNIVNLEFPVGKHNGKVGRMLEQKQLLQPFVFFVTMTRFAKKTGGPALRHSSTASRDFMSTSTFGDTDH